MSTNESITITGEDNIRFAQVLAIRSALSIEVKFPGMKHSRVNMLRAANTVMGTNFRRKAQALDALNAILTEAGFPPRS